MVVSFLYLPMYPCCNEFRRLSFWGKKWVIHTPLQVGLHKALVPKPSLFLALELHEDRLVIDVMSDDGPLDPARVGACYSVGSGDEFIL